MILINFAHPITPAQQEQIEAMTGSQVQRLIPLSSQVDVNQPLAPQIVAMADAAGLSPEQWQTEPILINPPALNVSAVTLLAVLHGRMGYFPPIVRIRPLPNMTPLRFEVAEIINLQSLRDSARRARTGA